MLQRLLFGLVAVIGLALAGCAHSPQQLDPSPKLLGTINPVGRGQPVVVRVVDGRPSPTLGTRGGLYPGNQRSDRAERKTAAQAAGAD